MEAKIKQYVDYQFRFDKREDLAETKEEIIANLIDRYHEYLNEGSTPEAAYIEAIKSVGDFTNNPVNDIPNEYSIKPSVPDILLLCSTILSIFGLLIYLFSNITGTIITVISILLFSSSAYYLYSYSQYVRKEEMNIEKHHLLLTKIFRYLKTNFVFWALSLSMIMAALVMRILSTLLLIDFSINDIRSYFLLYLIFFIIALIAFMLIFRNIYQRLMSHYYLLTGTTYLKGKIRESYEFLFGKAEEKGNIFLHRNFLPITALIIILIQLCLSMSYGKNYINYLGDINWYAYNREFYIVFLFNKLFNGQFFIVILPILSIILNITIIILMIIKKNIKEWLQIGSFYLWFICTLALYSFSRDELSNTVLNYSLIMTLVFTSILTIRQIIKRKSNGISR
jgi:hypothetical protein